MLASIKIGIMFIIWIGIASFSGGLARAGKYSDIVALGIFIDAFLLVAIVFYGISKLGEFIYFRPMEPIPAFRPAKRAKRRKKDKEEEPEDEEEDEEMIGIDDLDDVMKGLDLKLG